MRKPLKGYTLTDLVVLIGIIGIMMALAYPRYMALKSATKQGLVRNLSSNVKVSAEVAHLLWIVQDEPPTVVVDHQPITIVNGYPDQASIDDTLGSFSGFDFENIITAKFTKTDATVPSACMVSYANAAFGTSPRVDVLMSGC